MSEKEKIKYLSQYRNLCYKIRGNSEEIERLTALATNITQTLSLTPVNHNSQSAKMENPAMHIVEIIDQLKEETRILQKERNHVLSLIDKVRNPRYKMILTMWYVNGLSAREIANILDKTEQNIYKVRRNAIAEIEL